MKRLTIALFIIILLAGCGGTGGGIDKQPTENPQQAIEDINEIIKGVL